MIDFLKEHYSSENIIKFQSTLSYYQILTSQIFFEKDRIIFTVNFPIVQTENFELYQLIPIPQNNILYYPTTPFLPHAQQMRLVLEEPCNEIENRFYCIQKSFQADQCMISTISKEIPRECKQPKCK